MPRSMPSWFAADQVYQRPEGWYIGSPQSFRVGPYPLKADAERHSQAITEEIARCRDNGAVMRTVRAFLAAQQPSNSSVPSGAAVPLPPAPIHGSVNIPPREGEARGVRFRSSRYFTVGDAWFFATRENVDVGPYASKLEAERDAALLLRRLAGLETDAQRTLAIYEFKTRPRGGRSDPR